MERPTTRISATVLGAPDPRDLADFYEELLGWIRAHDEAGWVMLRPPADHQPQDHVRVMLDPVGNPFCLFPAPPAVQQVVDA